MIRFGNRYGRSIICILRFARQRLATLGAKQRVSFAHGYATRGAAM